MLLKQVRINFKIKGIEGSWYLQLRHALRIFIRSFKIASYFQEAAFIRNKEIK